MVRGAGLVVRCAALLVLLFALLAHGHGLPLPGVALVRGNAAALLAGSGPGRCAAEAVVPPQTRMPGAIRCSDGAGGSTASAGSRAERVPFPPAVGAGCALACLSATARHDSVPSNPVQPWTRLYLVHRNLRV